MDLKQQIFTVTDKKEDNGRNLNAMTFIATVTC